MTDFTLEEARRIARLARLDEPDDQLQQRTRQMASILSFVTKLQEVNTDGVEPLANVSDIALYLRPDVVNDGNYQSDVLANAPESMEGFFVVPKVVE